MKKLIVFVFSMLLATQAFAGEIIVKVPEEKLDSFVRIMGFVNRVFRKDVEKALDSEKISNLANTILPFISYGRVHNLSELQAQIFVMKDTVIIQMPDAILRARLEDSYKWCHVTERPSEVGRLTGVANTVLEVASLGRYHFITDVPAEITVRFDDKQYERE